MSSHELQHGLLVLIQAMETTLIHISYEAAFQNVASDSFEN